MPNPESPSFRVDSLLGEELATGIVVLDARSRILWCNESAEVFFGLSRKSLEGLDAAQFIPVLPDWIAKLNVERGVACSALLRVNAVAGAVRGRVLAVLSARGQKDFLLEMSDAEQAFTLQHQEQKEGLSDASHVLLRNLAHEIKNPLGGIRGAAQLLDAELVNPAQREYTGVIMSEADRLRELVDRLLEPYRDERHVTEINLHEVLEKVRNLVLAEFPSGLAIERDYDVSVPSFPADREQLTQVFLNLLRNAAQALEKRIADKSAQVVLRTRVERGALIQRKRYRLSLVVDVIDNGPGVVPSIREKIFYPLVTTRAHGTGLGLSLVRTYVERNAGEVELESEPGRTDFRIRLPLVGFK